MEKRKSVAVADVTGKWRGRRPSPEIGMRHRAALVEMALPGFDSAAPVEVPIVDRLRDATRPVMVQVAPGKYAPAKRNGRAPEMALCMWRDNGDGSLSPVPVTTRMVRLDSNLARLLGFAGQYATLRRLGEAGFIEIIKAAPGFTLLNLDSWFNHLRRCAENPEFWDRERKNYLVYKSVIV